MWLINKTLATAFSLYMLSWTTNCSWNGIKDNNENYKSDSTEVLKFPEILEPDSETFLPNNFGVTKEIQNQISLCLKTDSPDGFTTTWVLESVEDPQTTTLEFPVSQLFQKYWNRSHPLAVRWIKKDFRALLWKDWIENLSDSISQKLSPRREKITSDTQYEAWDTLRFTLIDPLLQWAFPQYLSDQLKEDGFETFSDRDSSVNAWKMLNKLKLGYEEKWDYIYDIVVKKLSTWKSALAVYRDWELFMTTYVSVWLNHRKTRTGQFEIIWKNPYYYSRKYKSPMPNWLNFDEWWFWFHQWNVTWYPASHGCVRLPWVYSLALYSLVKDKKHVDVFIDKNLYNVKK